MFEQEACIQVAGVAMIFADPSLPRPRYNGPTENTVSQEESRDAVSPPKYRHRATRPSQRPRQCKRSLSMVAFGSYHMPSSQGPEAMAIDQITADAMVGLVLRLCPVPCALCPVPCLA